MKRILTATVTLGILAGFAGCISLDEKLITGVSSAYYATPEGLNSALISSYGQLRNYYGREQLVQLAQMGTDTWSEGDQQIGGIGSNWDFNRYTSGLSPEAGPIQNTWNPAYQMIATLNTALDRGPGTTGIPAAAKNMLLGEAHFLRAFEYFMLVQTFGDVTLVLHENVGVSVEATRAPAADVYKAIIADLDTAIATLPVTTPDFGRATKGAAQTLLAKVYLTRGYKSYKEAGDFQKSLDLSKAVIASNTYALEPVYADLWCVARAADPGRAGYCDNTGYNANKKEFIFTVQFNLGQTTDVSGQGDQYNYLHLVYTTNYDNAQFGVGLARDINNGRPFRRLAPTQYELSLWNGRWAGTPGASDVVDTRFDGSFQSVWVATAGGQRNIGPTACPACTSGAVVNIGDTTAVAWTHQVSDAFRQSKAYTIRTTCPAGAANVTVYCGDYNQVAFNGFIGWDRYPALKKFNDNQRPAVANQEGSKVQVLLRLGEVYLLAAEADVNLGNYAEAAQMINVLRVRAASPAHKNDNNVTAAQIQAFPNVSAGFASGLDFIMEERERELAGEFNRWYDLVRPGAQYYVDRVKKYNYKATGIQTKFALRPIPKTQIEGVITGPPYPQNQGY